MDFSKFKTPDWLVIGGGLVVLIFGFVDWFSLEGTSGGGNGFDFIFTGMLPWLLIVASAVMTFLLVGGIAKAGAAPWTLLILGATGLGALLILIRLIIGADASDVFSGVPDGADVSLDRSAGLWLSVIGAIVAAAGAFLKFQAGGGNVRDLTDPNKIRDAFKS